MIHVYVSDALRDVRHFARRQTLCETSDTLRDVRHYFLLDQIIKSVEGNFSIPNCLSILINCPR